MELDGPTSLEAHRSHTCVSQLAHRSMRQTHLWFRIRNYGSAGIYSAKPTRGGKTTRRVATRFRLKGLPVPPSLQTHKLPNPAGWEVPRHNGHPLGLNSIMDPFTSLPG